MLKKSIRLSTYVNKIYMIRQDCESAKQVTIYAIKMWGVLTPISQYKEIAKNKNIRIDIVKKVFGEAENIIFQNLSDAQNQPCKITIMNGLNIQSSIRDKCHRTMPNGEIVSEGKIIKITSHISKRYKDKINQNR